MLRFKKILCCILSVMLTVSVSVLPIYAKDGANNNRELIAAFNFDNTGKTPGNKLSEYLSPNEDRTYPATFGNGKIKVSELKWSESSCVDTEGNSLGIMPQTGGVRLEASIEGYRCVEVTFDLGCVGSEETLGISYYNDNYREIPVWKELNVSGADTMRHYKISLKGTWIEDKYGKYNKLQLDISNGEFYINNIEFTGIKYSEDEKRGVMFGDADENEKITVLDATQIQKFISTASDKYFYINTADGFPDYQFCDVNSDGRVSILDVTCVQKYIAGQDDCGQTGTFSYSYNAGDIENM